MSTFFTPIRARNPARNPALEKRLLRDITELISKPYPSIRLHIQEHDVTAPACLILDTESYGPIHLTVHFGNRYPIEPPHITIQSHVKHPNVFNDNDFGQGYICASILDGDEDYTPAYTLKSIAITLLSFFCSENIEQDYGNTVVNLEQYKNRPKQDDSDDADVDSDDPGVDWGLYREVRRGLRLELEDARKKHAPECKRCGFGQPDVDASAGTDNKALLFVSKVADPSRCPIDSLPDEYVSPLLTSYLHSELH